MAFTISPFEKSYGIYRFLSEGRVQLSIAVTFVRPFMHLYFTALCALHVGGNIHLFFFSVFHASKQRRSLDATLFFQSAIQTTSSLQLTAVVGSADLTWTISLRRLSFPEDFSFFFGDPRSSLKVKVCLQTLSVRLTLGLTGITCPPSASHCGLTGSQDGTNRARGKMKAARHDPLWCLPSTPCGSIPGKLFFG